MDALHDAHTALQVDGLHLGRALLGGKIIDGQLGLAGLTELAQALLDEGQIQCFKVFVVQRAVRHFGVVGSTFKKVVQTDHLCRGALLHQRLCQTVGAVVLPLAEGPVSITIFAPEPRTFWAAYCTRRA